MKKKTIFLSAILLVLLYSGITYYKYKQLILVNKKMEFKLKNINQAFKLTTQLDSITIDHFEQKMSSEKQFLIYIGRPDCADCSLFEPLFIKYLNRNKEVKDKLIYLDVIELEKNKKKWNKFKKKYKIKYTPTIAFYSKGELKHKVQWTPQKKLSISDVKKLIKKINNY